MSKLIFPQNKDVTGSFIAQFGYFFPSVTSLKLFPAFVDAEVEKVKKEIPSATNFRLNFAPERDTYCDELEIHLYLHYDREATQKEKDALEHKEKELKEAQKLGLKPHEYRVYKLLKERGLV